MPSAALSASACSVLAFNQANQLAVRQVGARKEMAFVGDDLPAASARLQAVFPHHTPPVEYFTTTAAGRSYRIFFTQVSGKATSPEIAFHPIDQLGSSALEPALKQVVADLDPYLAEIPYLHLGENDFIYKFRPEAERNASIYGQDAAAGALYQSQLFAMIKSLTRRYERSASAPITLDFGAVRYVVPSHFGFCLGVKNAIERAYETLAENPQRRVFMLSELIHNPFVNEDLQRRGLRYLQTDKGTPYTELSPTGQKTLLWDQLTPEDIVIIPAFGATDEDKKRLVRKGLSLYRYDATCMLVEKVWKAARAYGRDGYTVLIHGKHEHEETKATFSNTRRYAQAVIVRNYEEAKKLGAMIASDDPKVRAQFYTVFAGKHTPGFEVDRDLARVAVVNQTTLLMNETREIIAYLKEVYATTYGPDLPGQPARVGGGSGRNDTLCYATQVNQDALARALTEPLDAALVVGGKNSSNTYQLYRLCAEKLGHKAFFIQSEANITSDARVEHHLFPGKDHGGHDHPNEIRPLWPEGNGTAPKRVLITGGASCPDGVIQQVINRINSLFPADRLRSADDVLRDLEKE